MGAARTVRGKRMPRFKCPVIRMQRKGTRTTSVACRRCPLIEHVGNSEILISILISQSEFFPASTFLAEKTFLSRRDLDVIELE